MGAGGPVSVSVLIMSGTRDPTWFRTWLRGDTAQDFMG